MKHIITLFDSLKTEFEIHNNHIINLEKEIKNAKDILDNIKIIELNNVIEILNYDLQIMWEPINKIKSKTKDNMDILNEYYKNAKNKIEKLDNLEKEQKELLEEQENHMRVIVHGYNMQRNQHALFFAKAFSSHDHHSTLGSGLELINTQMIIADKQAHSLEIQIKETKDKIIEAKKIIVLATANVFLPFINEQEDWLTNLYNNKIKTLVAYFAEIDKKVKKLQLLAGVRSEQSLRGAAARNDKDTLIKYLALKSSSPNIKDDQGNLAIYYAARFGAIDTFSILISCTTLNKMNKKNLLTAIPKNIENYTMMLAVLNNTQEQFNHLWLEQVSIGNNIINVIKDYYSPKIFEKFPFLNDQLKLILTNNWQRSENNIEFAKKIVGIFSNFDTDERSNIEQCCNNFKMKFNTYAKNIKSDYLEDDFFKRLSFIMLKLNLPMLANQSVPLYANSKAILMPNKHLSISNMDMAFSLSDFKTEDEFKKMSIND